MPSDRGDLFAGYVRAVCDGPSNHKCVVKNSEVAPARLGRFCPTFLVGLRYVAFADALRRIFSQEHLVNTCDCKVFEWWCWLRWYLNAVFSQFSCARLESEDTSAWSSLFIWEFWHVGNPWVLRVVLPCPLSVPQILASDARGPGFNSRAALSAFTEDDPRTQTFVRTWVLGTGSLRNLCPTLTGCGGSSRSRPAEERRDEELQDRMPGEFRIDFGWSFDLSFAHESVSVLHVRPSRTRLRAARLEVSFTLRSCCFRCQEGDSNQLFLAKSLRLSWLFWWSCGMISSGKNGKIAPSCVRLQRSLFLPRKMQMCQCLKPFHGWISLSVILVLVCLRFHVDFFPTASLISFVLVVGSQSRSFTRATAVTRWI